MHLTGTRWLMFAAVLLLASVLQAEAQWIKFDNIPRPFNRNHYLDVYFLPEDPDFIWICGFNGYVLRTTDGGDNWQGSQVPGPLEGGFGGQVGHLESVMFPTRDVGYCSGPEGLFKSVDGGATWTELFPPGLVDQWGLFFFDENEGVVVGGGCGTRRQQFFRTTDGGDTWQPFLGNLGLNSGLSDAIIFDPRGRALAVSSGYIWESADGGFTWDIFAQTGPAFWHEELTNLNESFLIPESGSECSGGGNTGGMRFSTDGGRNWTRFVVPTQQFGTYLESETTGWSCGSNGAVWYTNNAGVNWVPRDCGIDPNDDLDDITFIDERRGWVVGQGIYRWNLVDVKEPEIEVIGNVELCQGETVELVAEDGYFFYQWTNGQTGRSIVVDQPGTYRVEVFDESGCQTEISQAVNVTLRPAPDVGIAIGPDEDNILCEGETLELRAIPDGMAGYLWSTGELTQTITVSESGIYTVTITAPNGCVKVSDPFEVTVIPLPDPKILLDRPPYICADESVTMTVDNEYASYLWSTGETTRSIVVNSGGLYSVVVEDAYGCGGNTDEVEVIIRPDVENLQLTAIAADGVMRFPEQSPPDVVCADLQFTNISESDSFTFNEIVLLYNIEFSVPRSQFPFEILPGETRRMRVCFSPSYLGEFRDTIVFPEACFPLIPLESAGIPQFLSGESNCGVIITASTAEEDAGRLAIQFPYPNPAKTELRVPVEKSSDGEVIVNETAYLLNSFGTRVGDGNYRAYSNRFTERGGASESGEFIFDVRDITQGLYYLVVEKDGQRVSTPVVIAR